LCLLQTLLRLLINRAGSIELRRRRAVLRDQRFHTLYLDRCALDFRLKLSRGTFARRLCLRFRFALRITLPCGRHRLRINGNLYYRRAPANKHSFTDKNALHNAA
jgi:hypothetical protein